MNPKQDLGIIDIDQLFEEPEAYEDVGEESQEIEKSVTDNSEFILSQLVRNEEALNKLSTPLWLMFIALCILLIKFMI